MNSDDYIIGFDLGGTKMLCGAFDLNSRLLAREKKKTKAADGSKSVIERIIDCIEETIDEAECGKNKPKCIGIGVPGTIDLQSGVVLEAPNLGWQDIRLKKILTDKFDCEVILCNDVDAGLYGEYAQGSARGMYCSVGIFPGTGVGGGCVIDGNLLQGRRRTAMEVGHIPLYSGGPLDGAKNEGTLETIASRLAIAAASAQAVFRGAAPHLKETAGTDLSEIRSGVLAAAIKKGDKSIEDIINHSITYIGKMAMALIHLLSPDRVVLGGGLVEAMPDLFVKGVRDYTQKNVLDSFKGTYDIAPAELGDDAAIIGAASWARKTLGILE